MRNCFVKDAEKDAELVYLLQSGDMGAMIELYIWQHTSTIRTFLIEISSNRCKQDCNVEY